MNPPREALPEPPRVELETVRETRFGEDGFLVLRRMELVAVQDGTRSVVFAYDCIDRRAMDSAVIVAHHVNEGRVYVWLRSSVRPPVSLRPRTPSAPTSPVLWEVPAGLIEPGESPSAGAARELVEELGFEVDEALLIELGHPSLPAPGFIGELHHFFHVKVDPARRKDPEGDGSPIEAGARVIALPLEDALAACNEGAIQDEKTELALRRLADTVASAARA